MELLNNLSTVIRQTNSQSDMCFSAEEMRGIGKPGADERRADDLGDGAEDQGSTAPVETHLQQGALGRTLTLHQDRRPLAPFPGSPSPPRCTNIHSAKSINILSLYSSKKNFLQISQLFCFTSKKLFTDFYKVPLR